MEPMEPMQPMEPAQPIEPTQPVATAKPKKQGPSKKVIAIILAAVILVVAVLSIALSGSSNKNDALECDCEYCKQMFAYYNHLIESGQITLNPSTDYDPIYDSVMPDNPNDVVQQGDDSQQSDSQQSSSQEQSADPTKWTTAQIVETYKHAASRTHNSVTSHQEMTLRKGSLSAPGVNDTLVNLTANIMETVLENNSTDIKGITGGHQNLVLSDVKSARAYKSGSNIVIEMIMKEQVDKGNGNMYSGTVGHAISVVGPINNVVGQFSSLGVNAQIADSDATLHYKNPVVRVAINSSGYIINGTWSYYVNVTLNNMTISGYGQNVDVAQATAIIDFIVTLDGGFKA